MKFLAHSSLLALSIGAVSGSSIGSGYTLARRDATTIQNVLTSVSDQVQALDTAVKSFSGDTSGVTSASEKLLSIIKSGTSTVSGTSMLSQDDALQISSFVTGLNTSVATTVNDLISKKSDFVAACAGGTVLQELQDQKSASDALAQAITSKVPTALQSLAAQLSSGISDSLQSGVNSFQGASGGTCSSSGGSTPTSSGTGSSSGSASATATSSISASSSAAISTSSSGSASTGASTSSSASATPAVFTGAASANQVGTSALAFVVGCVALFM